MSTFKKARNQRVFYGSKAKSQRKKNRGESMNHQDSRVLSSKGFFKILALHAIFLNRSFGTNPKKYLGESDVVGRLTN